MKLLNFSSIAVYMYDADDMQQTHSVGTALHADLCEFKWLWV